MKLPSFPHSVYPPASSVAGQRSRRSPGPNPASNSAVQLIPRFLMYGAVFVVMTNLVPATGTAFLGLAALHALRGTRETVEALFVLSLAIMINKTLAPVDISLMRWGVLACAGVRTIWDTMVSDAPVPSPFWWLSALFATMVVFALTASWLPTVSLFKAISFYLGTGTALVALYRTRHLAAYWQSCFLTFAVFVILGSLPLYVLSSYGFARNGAGFQGLLTHPQTYGPISAVLTAYVTALVVYEGRRSKVMILTVLVGWAGVYFSLSRTGLLALVLAGGMIITFGWIRKEWSNRVPQMLSGPGLVVAVLAVCTAAVMWGPHLIDRGIDFLLKDESAEDIAGALEESRGGLSEQSMANFRDAPLTGIGLGVPSSLSRTTIEYGPFGVPIGASVEKGFTPTAVLEEIGAVGAGLLVSFLAALMVPIFRREGTIPLAWMVLTALLTNLGEAVIFAIGGNGLFFWLVLSLGYVCAQFGENHPAMRKIG